MALLTSYSGENCVVHSGKVVTYAKSKIYGAWVYVNGNITTTHTSAWEYTRYCAKSYSYVGMTEAAAMTCASEMVEFYTRDVKVSEWAGDSDEFSDASGGTIVMADIVPRRTSGDMWQVDINVRETDSRTRISGVASPSTLFATENSRDYDEWE